MPVKITSMLLTGILFTSCHTEKKPSEQLAPLFIIIGQSNADGSAFFDPDEDARLKAWYTSNQNPGNIKIWYRSTQIENIADNGLGERARHVIDGKITDVEPGWLDLWYRNENTDGRTAMNMIHGYGTYSTGNGTDCAQGRRGIEGQFGLRFSSQMPDTELYLLKLGASGSFISSWTNDSVDHNWQYFYNHIYRPAINDLLAKGKRPVLAGIWWMQGCADSARDSAYYASNLHRLIERCRTRLGFPDAHFYIGQILAPGESDSIPQGSAGFGPGVRAAQIAVAADTPGVTLIDVSNISMQYEPNFSGYIHFDHAGQNALADSLANHILTEGIDHWARFTSPDSIISTGSKK